MEIISHRGYWKDIPEKNSETAFHRSFELGFGTETDLRDRNGEIVISHDMAGASNMSFAKFLEIYTKYPGRPALALNVKADGLQKPVKDLLYQHGVSNYFMFDMSVPDTLGYLRDGINIYSRQSEYEAEPAFYDQCSGVWLDAFIDTWYAADVIKTHVQNGKAVAIVSSELHKREHKGLWEMLKDSGIAEMNGVLLCTDIPEDAKQFFF